MKVVVYQSKTPRRSQRWRWYVRADNGRKVATSGEGYANLDDLLDMCRKLFPHIEVELKS